jgi:hypothetical protein
LPSLDKFRGTDVNPGAHQRRRQFIPLKALGEMRHRAIAGIGNRPALHPDFGNPLPLPGF